MLNFDSKSDFYFGLTLLLDGVLATFGLKFKVFADFP